MRPLLWPFTVSSMYMDYTNILVYVNTAIFCVNNRILFPIHKKFLFLFWKFGYYSHTPFVSSCLWNWLCFSSEENAFSSHSLFSVWPFLTEVYHYLHPYLPRTQVSYSLVVECVLFAVQGNESDGSLCLQLSMACDACTCFEDWAHDRASHGLKQSDIYWDQQDLSNL